MVLWVAFFMSLLNVYLAINWLPTSLNASGFTQQEAAVITSLYHVGGVAGTYALGLLMDRAGPYAMLMFALVLTVVGFYFFATLPTLTQGIAIAVLMATGFGVNSIKPSVPIHVRRWKHDQFKVMVFHVSGCPGLK